MSKLSEYLALIPKGLKHIPELVEGLVNEAKIELGTIPQEDLEVIVGRRLICSQCPYLSTNAEKAGYYKSARSDVHCTCCGCPISTRTASLTSNCGLEETNKENPEHPIPLKWVATK